MVKCRMAIDPTAKRFVMVSGGRNLARDSLVRRMLMGSK